MKRLTLLTVLAIAVLGAQRRDDPRHRTLPDGRSHADLIIEANHEKALEDTAELLKLAEELHSDLEENGHNVLPYGAVEKAKEIEKLSKKIQKHLKRY